MGEKGKRRPKISFSYFCIFNIWIALLFPYHMMLIFVCQGCHNKVPLTEWIKQKSIFSQFQRLEVHDQGLGRDGFFCGAPSLACRRTSSSAFSGLPSVHVCVLISSSYKDTSHIGLGPTHNFTLITSHFTLITSLKALSPNAVTF